MYCPKYLRRYVKNYYEKKVYENIISRFDLFNLDEEDFTFKFIGSLNKSFFFGHHIKEGIDDHLSIVAVSSINNLILLLFDNNMCGYSNCFENVNLNEINIDKYNDFHCLKCLNDKFKISLFYEYIDDKILKEEDIEILDYSNAFQWIRINIQCSKCGKKYKNIVDFED